MIGAIFMIFVAIWIYQSAIRAKTANIFYWVAGGAAAFFITQFLLIYFDVSILEAFRSSDGGDAYESVNGADRKNEGDYQGFFGVLKSLYLELAPQVFAFLIIAVLRNRFMLKEDLNVTNLFSGLKEMFSSIAGSFKTAANKE